ncbi:MAG: hypothetical protein ACYDH6_02580 [Acidimicrobiales bacterium]
MTSVGAYITGWAVLAALVVPLLWAAVEVRRWLLPGWQGAYARLVESVLSAVLVILVAESVGVVGLFDRAGLDVAGLVIGCATAAAVRRLPRRRTHAVAPPVPADPWALAGAVAAVLGVAAQWTAWTAQAMRQGMTAYDAVFYHGPMAARFAQTGDLTRLHSIVPGEAVTFYPATTEVWHAIGIVAFRADLLSPLLNLAFLAVAVLAAWCIGRRLGGAPAAIAGIALVSAMPYVAASQPGSSFNDAAGLAALLAAAALFVRVGDERGAGLVAALSAGLAIGVKLSFVAPAVLVAAACTALLPRGRRLITLGGWAVVMAVSGGFWYARNLVRVGNPLPGIGLGLPAPSLPVDARYGTRLIGSLDLSAHGWRTLYRVGLQDYFGRAWPGMALLVLLGVGGGIALWRRSPWHRAIAIAAAISAFVYTITPVTGDPAFFRFNLRYTLPIQGMAALLLATHPRLSGRHAQRAVVALTLVGLAAAWPGPARGADPFQLAGWPDGSGHRLAAVAVTVSILALVAVIAVGATHVTARVALASVLVVGAIVAGWGVTERYSRGRYRHFAGELGPSWQWAQAVSHSRIGVVGLYQQYPFFGAHLDNVVQYVGISTAHHGLARAPSCTVWRRSINAGRYRYIVTSREGIFPPPGEPPEATWTRSDPAARELLHTGDTAVFRITGPMHPASCPHRT